MFHCTRLSFVYWIVLCWYFWRNDNMPDKMSMIRLKAQVYLHHNQQWSVSSVSFVFLFHMFCQAVFSFELLVAWGALKLLSVMRSLVVTKDFAERVKSFQADDAMIRADCMIGEVVLSQLDLIPEPQSALIAEGQRITVFLCHVFKLSFRCFII